MCELLAEQLLPLLEGRASVEHIDISTDPVLERRYGLRIPILACADGELSAYPLDEVRVREFLDNQQPSFGKTQGPGIARNSPRSDS